MDMLSPRVVKVTKEDYDKVMAIAQPGEIYSGTDYLPDYFNMLLDMPNTEAHAVAIGDKFVSFQILQSVDTGLTKVSRAARTHRDYAGRGFNAMIQKHLESSPSYKNPKYIASTGGTHVKQHLKRIEAGLNYKVMIMDYYEFTINKLQLKEHLKKTIEPDQSLIHLDGKRLRSIFGQKRVCQHLFPEDRVVVDWMPYRPMESNAELIMTTRTTAIMSGNSVDTLLLTFGNFFHAPVGCVYNIEVYGLTDRSEDHLVEHFKNIVARAVTDNIVIRCFAREKSKWDKINDVMKKFDFGKTSLWGTGLLCKERITNGDSKL